MQTKNISNGLKKKRGEFSAMKQVMEASEAVATAVRMCKPAVIPMYPITPQFK